MAWEERKERHQAIFLLQIREAKEARAGVGQGGWREEGWSREDFVNMPNVGGEKERV